MRTHKQCSSVLEKFRRNRLREISEGGIHARQVCLVAKSDAWRKKKKWATETATVRCNFGGWRNPVSSRSTIDRSLPPEIFRRFIDNCQCAIGPRSRWHFFFLVCSPPREENAGLSLSPTLIVAYDVSGLVSAINSRLSLFLCPSLSLSLYLSRVTAERNLLTRFLRSSQANWTKDGFLIICKRFAIIRVLFDVEQNAWFDWKRDRNRARSSGTHVENSLQKSRAANDVICVLCKN